MSSGHELLAIEEVEYEVPWKPLNGQDRKGGTRKVESKLTSKPLKHQSRMALYLKSLIVDAVETSNLSKSQGALPETLNLNKVGASNIKGKHMELNFDNPELQILKHTQMVSIVFPAPRGAWQAPKISPRGLRNASGKTNLDCFVRFPGVPGSPKVSSQKIHGGSEMVREG